MLEGIRWIMWIAVLAVSSRGADQSEIKHTKTETASKISQLKCPKIDHLLIVKATFDATGQNFTHDDLVDTYKAIAKKSTGKQLSQSGSYTITYICADDDSLISPCRPKSNSSGPITDKTSLFMTPSDSQCYKLVNITIASHQEQPKQQERLNVAFNVLFKEEITSDGNFIDYRQVNSEGKAETWECLKGGYKTLSVTRNITLTIRLQLKSVNQIMRFWVNLDAIVDYVKRIVVPVLGVVIVTVIIAVIVYIVKRRTRSSRISTAEREDKDHDQHHPRSRNDVVVHPHYSSPYMHDPANDSDTPEDTLRKPKLKYCTHNPDDYEDWVPPFLRMDTDA